MRAGPRETTSERALGRGPRALDMLAGRAHAFWRRAVNLEGAHRLRRVLLSLTDVTLRVGWLRAYLAELRDGDAAEQLCSLCEDGERADPDSREALLVVAM